MNVRFCHHTALTHLSHVELTQVPRSVACRMFKIRRVQSSCKL